MSQEQATQRVERKVSLIVSALDHVKFTTERNHNFLSHRVVKIIPSVDYTTHESCKALGRAWR